jgi:hypothetical protein
MKYKNGKLIIHCTKDLCKRCRNFKNYICEFYNQYPDFIPKKGFERLIECMNDFKKVEKKTDKRKDLIDELDKVWSLLIRKRDKKCMLSLSDKELQAHHYIKHRTNMKYRWDLRNGIALNAGVHKYKVHRNEPEYKNTLKEIAIVNGIISNTDYKIICDDYSVNKIPTYELEDKLKQLKEQL